MPDHGLVLSLLLRMILLHNCLGKPPDPGDFLLPSCVRHSWVESGRWPLSHQLGRPKTYLSSPHTPIAHTLLFMWSLLLSKGCMREVISGLSLVLCLKECPSHHLSYTPVPKALFLLLLHQCGLFPEVL